MNAIATKLQTGTAACAIAIAATLTPAVVAHADPAAPVPLGSLGGAAGSGSTLCDPVGSPNCSANTVNSSPSSRPSFRAPTRFAAPSTAPSTASSAAPSVGATIASPGSIFQNEFWWFGTPNPNPPERTVVFTFYPLALIPAFIRPLFSWFEDINFEACVFGFSLRIGPYGAVTGSYGRGCA